MTYKIAVDEFSSLLETIKTTKELYEAFGQGVTDEMVEDNFATTEVMLKNYYEDAPNDRASLLRDLKITKERFQLLKDVDRLDKLTSFIIHVVLVDLRIKDQKSKVRRDYDNAINKLKEITDELQTALSGNTGLRSRLELKEAELKEAQELATSKAERSEALAKLLNSQAIELDNLKKAKPNNNIGKSDSQWELYKVATFICNS